MTQTLTEPQTKNPNWVAPDKVQEESDGSPLAFRIGLGLILIGAFVLYVSIGANWAKFSRAEVFFAECAREMLRSNNPVTPLYHGQPFFDKPILAYWLIMGVFKAFGTTHLMARVPSIIAALVSVGITASGAAVLFGRRAGLVAAMSLASSFMFFSFACLCMSDMLLVMFDCISMSLLYAGVQKEKRRTLYWMLAAASMGLAFLTKGPIGIVLPGAALLAFLAITRQLSVIRPVHLIGGALTAAIFAAPWFIAAYNANGMSAIIYFFVRENFQRFAGSTYDTHKPIWFMAVSLFTGFMPWSIFLPIILWKSAQKWRAGLNWPEARHELYLWIWIAVVTGFFSLSRGKCDYYVLPAYPAAAMLVGLYLSRWITRAERPAVFAGWGLSAAYVIVGVASSVILSKIVDDAPVSQWILMPALLVASGALVGLAMFRKRVMHAYTLAFVGICLAATGFALQILPAISRLQMTAFYTVPIRQSPPETRIGVDASLAHWIDEITFQTGREPVRVDTTADLQTLLSDSKPVLVIVPIDRFQRLPDEMMDKVRVTSQTLAISHALTPGYAIQRKGVLTDPLPLVLVSNRP